jgi:hypothetical protein
LAVCALAAVLVLSLAAWPGLREEGHAPCAFASQVTYFSLLGAGFMLVEVSLIQKLILYLGYPVLSLSVILFALLLGGSLGSLHSQGWSAGDLARRLPWVAGAVVAYGAVLLAVIPSLMRGTLFLGIELRSLFTMAALLPLAGAMGMLFPSGLRLLAARSPHAVPWMWGVNGLTSVAGSVFAMILAKFYGFSVVLLLGLGLYVLVAILVRAGWAFPDVTGAVEVPVANEGDL